MEQNWSMEESMSPWPADRGPGGIKETVGLGRLRIQGNDGRNPGIFTIWSTKGVPEGWKGFRKNLRCPQSQRRRWSGAFPAFFSFAQMADTRLESTPPRKVQMGTSEPSACARNPPPEMMFSQWFVHSCPHGTADQLPITLLADSIRAGT